MSSCKLIIKDQVNVKFENLDQDFIKLKETLDLNCELGKANVNKSRTHYRDYYDNKTKDIIENHFEKELNTFQYKF